MAVIQRGFRLPIAVIDNTLLSRLDLLGISEKLSFIFRQIRIPPEVKKEAFKSHNKKRLRNLLNGSGSYFINCIEFDPPNKELLRIMPGIDEGEAAAIAQAEATGSALISDDQQGYYQAIVREIDVYRTGKILCLLKEAGQLGQSSKDNLVAPYLEKLIKSGFFIGPRALQEILANAAELDSLDKLILVTKQSNAKK